jgi:hypothetical protein
MAALSKDLEGGRNTVAQDPNVSPDKRVQCQYFAVVTQSVWHTKPALPDLQILQIKR